MGVLRTALYCRLSKDDMAQGDSGSIKTQKLILQRYADEHFFLNTRFFVDDGFSGVSFEREGLQAMLCEVEAGNVATVITKDLSRLGRNSLKTGELIEIIRQSAGWYWDSWPTKRKATRSRRSPGCWSSWN